MRTAAPIARWDFPHRERTSCLCKAFLKMVRQGFGVIVVLTSGPSWLKAFTSRLSTASGRGYRLFAITDEREIKDAEKLLSRVKVWHKPYFHIVVVPLQETGAVLQAAANHSKANHAALEQIVDDMLVGYLTQSTTFLSATVTNGFSRQRLNARKSDRWLSKDPIGISGGLNQYVFAGDNPASFSDPHGLFIYEGWQAIADEGYQQGGIPGTTKAWLGWGIIALVDTLGGEAVRNTAANSGSAAGCGDAAGAVYGDQPPWA